MTSLNSTRQKLPEFIHNIHTYRESDFFQSVDLDKKWEGSMMRTMR